MKKMDNSKITVAKAMVECLKAEGIETVFGYPGAAICPFYDELYSSDIKHVLVRHEANGGHAASGYARITGKPAVAIATSGPGATNIITAIATAYMDSIPMVIITGQVNSEQIGRDVFQEADITGSAEPFVKHSFLLKNADEVAETFKKAFYIAGTGRPGPVLIDIPYDVQLTKVDFEYPSEIEIRSYKPSSAGNKMQIKRVLSALEQAEKPLICAGGGLFSGDAKNLMVQFAERCDIPVVTTMMGISSISSDNPLNLGMLGMHGVKVANIAVNECDLLILLGARVGDRAVATMKNSNMNVIHIDIDPAEIGKNIEANIPVVGDITTILSQIMESVPRLEHKEWIEKLSQINSDKEIKPCKNVNPKLFIKELNIHLPDNTVIVSDVGQNQIWTANNIKLKKGRFMTSGGMGTMGYSVPAAIGAKAAAPENEVIAICGDGSFQMQFMELATMVQHGFAVKIIVMKNNYLGMVREVQQKLYKEHYTAVSLDGSPDFIKLAQAYGISSERVTRIEEAEQAIKRLINSKKPYLIEVLVDEFESTLL